MLIIGGGFSGIGAAVALEKAGIRDYLIADDNDGFGGTWRWNTYPGIAVDIPSFSYQYSFAKRPDWSRVYAPGAELRAYAEDCAQRYGLRAKTRFGVRVTGARFDEQAHAWTVSTRDGEEIVARHVIAATGVLTNPKPPDIPGVETFAGTTAPHRAVGSRRRPEGQARRGDRDGRLRRAAHPGDRGRGRAPDRLPADADLVPAEARPRDPARRDEHRCGACPAPRRLARLLSQTLVELTFTLAAHYHRGYPLASASSGWPGSTSRRRSPTPSCATSSPRATRSAASGRASTTSSSRPSTAPMSTSRRRRSRGSRRTRSSPRTAPSTRSTCSCSRPASRSSTPATCRPIPSPAGAARTSRRSGPRTARQAYEGVSVPGFPNYFWMFGPYGYNGSSYFNLVETQARHIVRCLSHARERGATSSRSPGGQRPLLRGDAPSP